MTTLENNGLLFPTSPKDISYKAMLCWQGADQIGFVKAITGTEQDEAFCAAYCEMARALVNDVASMSGGKSCLVEFQGKQYECPEIGEMPTEMFVAATKATTDLARLQVYCPVTEDMPYHLVKPLLAFFLSSWRELKRSLLHGLRASQHLDKQRQVMSDYQVCSDGIRLLPKRLAPTLN